MGYYLDKLKEIEAKMEIKKSKGFYGHKGRLHKRGGSLPRNAAKNPSNLVIQTLNPKLMKLADAASKELTRDAWPSQAEDIVLRLAEKFDIDPDLIDFNRDFDTDDNGHKYHVINFDLKEPVWSD
jgi:hypothetical protein